MLPSRRAPPPRALSGRCWTPLVSPTPSASAQRVTVDKLSSLAQELAQVAKELAQQMQYRLAPDQRGLAQQAHSQERWAQELQAQLAKAQQELDQLRQIQNAPDEQVQAAQAPAEQPQGESVKLPTWTYLGRGVNLLANPNIFKVNDILETTNLPAIIKLVGEKKAQIPGLNGAHASLAENVRFVQGASQGTANYLTVLTGSELIDKLSTGVEFSGSYSAVTVSAGANYSYEKSVKRTDLYALYSSQTEIYSVLLDDEMVIDNINPRFWAAAKALPDLDENGTHEEAYRKFFFNWGTHVIVRGTVGTRYQFKVQTSDVVSSDKETWGLSVKANYAGVISGNANVNQGTVEDRFKNTVQGQVNIIGGDESSRLELLRDHDNKAKFDKWCQSRGNGQNESTTKINVKTIGDLLSGSPADEYQTTGAKLNSGLSYLLRGGSAGSMQHIRGVIYYEGWESGNGSQYQVGCEIWGSSPEITDVRVFQPAELHSHKKEYFQIKVPNSWEGKGNFGMDKWFHSSVSSGLTINAWPKKELTVMVWGSTGIRVVMELFPRDVEGVIRLVWPARRRSDTITIDDSITAKQYTAK
ncbi:hypothetical protein UA08_05090 [Talaromyces atroroseus]|uniref:MACPF domain-containing protein n=1 Tax=Talaromyces atroroseus TaxID=1441469 RepID=A0A225AQR7_TALAT|nr:hypothetical protein UA08_05090 [Talaromyces atroroseus]OKL59598.1 hypothetical protein UA08_05090 [Talaromyces atroroseus]